MAPDLTLSGSDWLCFPERPPERPPVGGFLSMPHALKLGAMSAKPLLRLGTRGSPLALAQAEEVRRRLAAAHPELADRQSGGQGQRVSVRVDFGGRRISKKSTKHANTRRS